MADMNVFAVVGRLVRDPELKHNQGGRPICRITIANNVGFGKNATVNYIRAVAAGQAAEYLAKYGEKGRTVSINGEVRLGSYKNDDGTYNNTTTVFIKDIAFIGNGYSGDKEGHGGTPEAGNVPQEDKFQDTVSKAYADAYSETASEPPPQDTAGDDIPF